MRGGKIKNDMLATEVILLDLCTLKLVENELRAYCLVCHMIIFFFICLCVSFGISSFLVLKLSVEETH